MAAARPELVFLTGPQQGERAVLMSNVVLMGRSAAADVRLSEEYASREQVRLILTSAGWVMENLSANGTLVNGKRYKSNRRLFVETGDVLGVGLESQVLYVAAGDDPEEALRIYREAHPDAAAKVPEMVEHKPKVSREEVLAEAGAVVGGDMPLAPAAAAEGPRTAPVKPDDAEAEAAEAEEGGSRKLKYILVGALLVGVSIFAAVLILRPGGGPAGPGRSDTPARLSAEEIGEALAAPVVRSPSPMQAADALDRAVRAFPDREQRTGDLYRCVKNFKLHLAYKQSKSFRRIEDERMFAQAAHELDQLIHEKYDAAWKFEQNKSWRQAQAAFEEMLAILPIGEVDQDEPVYRIITKNSIAHLTYIKRNLGKKEE